MNKREYLHDHNSLLHDVAYPSRDKVQQYINTSLSAGFYLHRSLPYGLDATPHKADVNLGGISAEYQSRIRTRSRQTDVLFQLAQQCVDIVLVGQANHDVQLFDFDIQRVVILAENHAHLI